MAEKLSKDETDYSLGMQNTHCGPVFHNDQGYCDHYRGDKGSLRFGSCEVVEGSINPVYWCNRFKKVSK